MSEEKRELTAPSTVDPQIMNDVLMAGDLAKLSPVQKTNYYNAVCQSLGLNPLTKPFDYIKLNGKETLYACKGATDQLRRIYGVSIKIVREQQVGDLWLVTAEATDNSGRTDSDTGFANIKGLSGDALGNAILKATTKAKRRVTLSICGLGMLDETEVETIQQMEPRTLPKQNINALEKFKELIVGFDDANDLIECFEKSSIEAQRQMYKDARERKSEVANAENL